MFFINISTRHSVMLSKKYSYSTLVFVLFILVIGEQFVFWYRRKWGLGNELSAFLLAFVGISIAVMYVYTSSQSREEASSTSLSRSFSPAKLILWTVVGFMSVAVSYEELRKLFAIYPMDFNSDVLPVMEAQARRFLEGIHPYRIVRFETYDVYPPYLPAFWIPLLPAVFAGIDIRWVAYFVFAISTGVFGYFYASKPLPPLPKLIGICIMSTVIWSYYFYDNEFSLSSTSEALVVAYYLLLVMGIYYDNLVLIIVSLIACLLSRYNILFWLPLAGFFYYQNHTRAQSLKLFLWVIGGILGLYIIPFVIQYPEILFSGLKQWKIATEAAWDRAISNPNSATYVFNGISLNRWFCLDIVAPTTMEKISLMQKVQMVILLLFSGLAAVYYHYYGKSLNYRHYLLGTLKIYFTLFFFLNPIVFPYYLMPAFAISLFLWAQTLRSPLNIKA